MSKTTDFIAELVHAANTMAALRLPERRRLVERGVATVKAQRELILLHGNVVPLEPGFLSDMQSLAQMAGEQEGVEVLVSAGLLLLAGEIRRLRVLNLESN